MGLPKSLTSSISVGIADMKGGGNGRVWSMGGEEFVVVSYLTEIVDRFLGHEIKCLEICTTGIGHVIGLHVVRSDEV